MKDPVFHRIVIDDMYGLAEHMAKEEVKKEKSVDWEARMKEYMAKRLQYMYRSVRCILFITIKHLLLTVYLSS